MAFTVEGNFALKDMLIRSEFRLVDVEVRVNEFRSPNRVSSLLARKLAGQAAADERISNQMLPPGVFPLEGFGGGPFGTPGGPIGMEPSEGLAAAEVVGKQVYTLRGDTDNFAVYRSAPLIADGILVRVTGEATTTGTIRGDDEGYVFLISDAEQLRSTGRLGGDHDLMVPGSGTPSPERHGITVLDRHSTVGAIVASQWDIRFHTPVRAGQRLCVEQSAAGQGDWWAAFEVAQFAGQRSQVGYVGELIRESVPVDPPVPVFQPVIMQENIFFPRGKVVESLAEVNNLLIRGWIIVGNVFSDGIFPT